MTSRHKHNHSRRDFLQAAVAAGTTLPLAGNWTAAEAAEKRSANEKLNLAVIGVAGRGGANLSGVQSDNCRLSDNASWRSKSGPIKPDDRFCCQPP